MEGFIRFLKPRRLPVVLAREELRRLLGRMQGQNLLMAQLLYGGGLRLMECVRLRVKDVDFEQGLIVVRDGKGAKNREEPANDERRTGRTAHGCRFAVRRSNVRRFACSV